MQKSAPIRDADRLIQAIYTLAVDADWESFRGLALAEVCRWLGASGGVWLTRSPGKQPGEFTQHPANLGLSRKQLTALAFPAGQREIEFEVLPPELLVPGDLSRDSGWALSYAHRGGSLTSIVLLRFRAGAPVESAASMQRAVGHMVEAGGLSLRQFIKRDEWLQQMGRTSRGTATLVDADGVVYAASDPFREMVASQSGDAEFDTLPCRIPEEALELGGAFFYGPLHFRVQRYGNLYLLHARRPLPLDGLSPREQEIARALSTGKTFKSVARQYDIAVSTVANHASRIYRKLGIYRREDLVELVRARVAH